MVKNTLSSSSVVYFYVIIKVSVSLCTLWKDGDHMFNLWIKTEELTDSLALYAEIEEFKINLTDLIDYSLIYGDCTLEDALTVISLTEKYSHILSISLQKEQV